MSLAISVAKELTRLADSGPEPDPLTNLRLQKLLYYVQGWSLVARESQFFPEGIEAWRHGPVVPDVYHGLPKDLGCDPIIQDYFQNAPDLSAEEQRFVSSVWEAYKGYSATALRQKTHQESPWKDAWGDRPADGSGNDPIGIDAIDVFFASQDMPGPIERYERERIHMERDATRKLAERPRINKAKLAARATYVSGSLL